MPLLQLLGSMCDDFPDFLILAVERGGKRLLTSNKVFLLGVHQSLLLLPGSVALAACAFATSWAFLISAYFRMSSRLRSSSSPSAVVSSSRASPNQTCV